MLPLSIIEQIKQRSGMRFENPKDFEVLSASLPYHDRLGVNTLKRLMGYANAPIEPRKTTLDALAHYLGHDTWEALMGIQPSDSDWTEKAVYADEVNEGTTVEIHWLPDRKLRLQCIGENRFLVIESLNGRLQVNDEVSIQQFRVDYPLEMAHIVRDGNALCDDKGAELCYIAGKKNGITSLKIND